MPTGVIISKTYQSPIPQTPTLITDQSLLADESSNTTQSKSGYSYRIVPLSNSIADNPIITDNPPSSRDDYESDSEEYTSRTAREIPHYHVDVEWL